MRVSDTLIFVVNGFETPISIVLESVVVLEKDTQSQNQVKRTSAQGFGRGQRMPMFWGSSLDMDLGKKDQSPCHTTKYQERKKASHI